MKDWSDIIESGQQNATLNVCSEATMAAGNQARF